MPGIARNRGPANSATTTLFLTINFNVYTPAASLTMAPCHLLILLLTVALPCIPVNAFTPDETVCVMTQDDVCLSTSIYYASTGKKPWPCVYRKTPYDKQTLDPTQWNDAGFCFIAQDVCASLCFPKTRAYPNDGQQRGRSASNGSYSIWRASGNDTIDTIKWLLQPEQAQFSNGYLGVTGVSADAVCTN